MLVNAPPGACSGMYVSPCDDACEVISINAEPGTGIEIKEPISFPEIKAEPDEVSYMSLCHQYTKIARLFSGLSYLGLPT